MLKHQKKLAKYNCLIIFQNTTEMEYEELKSKIKLDIADVIIKLNLIEGKVKSLLVNYIKSEKNDFLENVLLNNMVINLHTKITLLRHILIKEGFGFDKELKNSLQVIMSKRNILAHSEEVLDIYQDLIDVDVDYNVGEESTLYGIFENFEPEISFPENGKITYQKVSKIVGDFNKHYDNSLLGLNMIEKQLFKIPVSNFSYHSLTDTEKISYNDYKTNGTDKENPNGIAFTLNENLREGTSLSEQQKQCVKILDSLIGRFYNPEKVILFRASGVDCIEYFIHDKVYRYPAFMSTAMKQDVIARNGHAWQGNGQPVVILEIHCRAGIEMLPMDSNPDGGESEYEMLLGRNSVFKVTSQAVITNKILIDDLIGPTKTDRVGTVTKYIMEFSHYEPN